jgi:hypothetical protein
MKSTHWQTGPYHRQTSCQTLSLLASKIIFTKCLRFSLLIIKSINANAKEIDQEVQILSTQKSFHQTKESLILKLTATHRAIFNILNMTHSLSFPIKRLKYARMRSFNICLIKIPLFINPQETLAWEDGSNLMIIERRERPL